MSSLERLPRLADIERQVREAHAARERARQAARRAAADERRPSGDHGGDDKT